MSDLIADLSYRGLIYQATDLEGLSARLAKGPITLYIGFDPTADSLHIGSLLQILLLRRFQLAGHCPIGVVGGGTGLIGDPSGKSQERQLNDVEVVQEWTDSIRSQVGRYLDFDSSRNAARIVSNYDWLADLKLVPFLREIGKHFSVNQMLAKESVSARLATGISYTEFSYMTLQAFDFLHLLRTLGAELQCGGSDQWGNITAGADLIRRVTGETAYGLTLPLITTADGKKYGKTEAGTIWLDPELTSPYRFYQFWMQSDDAEVIPLLKAFTFLPAEEIERLAAEVAERPSERAAQRRLAAEVTDLVHGPEAAASAAKVSQALFYGRVSDLNPAELALGLNDVPSYELQAAGPVGLVELLVRAGVSNSKRQARHDIQNGAISVNDARVTEPGRIVTPDERLAGRYVVVRRGKNNYFLIDWRI
ncbi:MAG: tyrosine--tRNA ligase [Candidatus Promineifilaceae bacterium]